MLKNINTVHAHLEFMNALEKYINKNIWYDKYNIEMWVNKKSF